MAGSVLSLHLQTEALRTPQPAFPSGASTLVMLRPTPPASPVQLPVPGPFNACLPLLPTRPPQTHPPRPLHIPKRFVRAPAAQHAHGLSLHAEAYRCLHPCARRHILQPFSPSCACTRMRMCTRAHTHTQSRGSPGKAPRAQVQ